MDSLMDSWYVLPENIAAALFYIGAIGLVGTCVWETLIVRGDKIKTDWSLSFAWPFRSLIALDRAAFIAYKELRKKPFNTTMEKMSKPPRISILTMYATYLAHEADMFERHPLFGSIEPVPKENWLIQDDGRSVTNITGGILNKNPMIYKSHLKEFIRQKREER